MNNPALILILILAVAIVAAYFYLRRRQQQTEVSDTPQNIAPEATYTRDTSADVAAPPDVAPPREDQLP